MSQKLRVFLCHASQDRPIVRELYQRLLTEGWIDPWLDEEKLLPGQDWDLEIEKAVEESDAVIVFLSNNSVSKEGYVQKELRKILDVADEKPEGTVFIIPLRINDCETPRRLRMWQRVDFFATGSYEKLIKSLQLKSESLNMSTSNSLEESLPPLAQELFTYVIGDDVEDESYIIKASDGKELGKYGIRVSKRIHQPKVGAKTAFDIWLYDAMADKGIVGTLITKRKYMDAVLFNTRQTIQDGLIGAEIDKPPIFETDNLRMVCVISELQYDEGIDASENRFVLLALKMKVWSKK